MSGEARLNGAQPGSTGLNGAEAAASETGGSLPRLRGEGKGAGSSPLTGEAPPVTAGAEGAGAARGAGGAVEPCCEGSPNRCSAMPGR